jgi:outer membrane biogenesis lipoprotein LolB
MKRHFITLLAIGTLLLTGCVSTSDAETQNTQVVQATEESSQSSTEAPEAEEAEATMEEEGDGDNLASSEQQPSEAIGSTNEVLETSASSLNTLIESLKVAAETPNGYDRGLFKH